MATTAEEPITQESTGASTIDVPVTSSAPAVPERADRLRRSRRPLSSGPRRTRVTVRRFGVLSVLKFSLIFSFCAMLTIWLALLMIYLVLQAGGVMDSIGEWLGQLSGAEVGTKGYEPVEIDGRVVFTYLFLGGCVLAAAWALVMTFASVIYNLIADMVGGIEVTLSERSRR
ncbi:MAG TPA: DUF3566 domain-containing protein [Actinomycetota bacterium]